MDQLTKKIRIGCGQGFWGDWLEAPELLVKNGDLDYLILDYLAEVTMSILAKQKEKNSDFGYGRDFPSQLLKLGEHILDKNLKVIANAGGLNPVKCAEICINLFKERFGGNSIPKIAIVEGDNLMPLLDAILEKNIPLDNLETNVPIEKILSKIKSINAYIGCDSVVEALKAGAQVIITGRLADPSMCLAPLIHEYSWDLTNYDLLAGGIVAGHLIECGAQSTGGNFSAGWENVTDLWNIGYPIVEFSEDGSFIISKAKNSGGEVSEKTVAEQLVYEIGDPKNYITPDVIVDFSNIKLEEVAIDQVKVTGVKGKKKPDKLKVSATYHAGYAAEGTLVIVGPKSLKKAEKCKEILTKRFHFLGLKFDEIIFENLGSFACIPGMSEKFQDYDPPELVFRVAARSEDKKVIERFTREIAPLVLSGPSGITGYAGGKKEVREIFSYWPSLIDRKKVKTSFKFIN